MALTVTYPALQDGDRVTETYPALQDGDRVSETSPALQDGDRAYFFTGGGPTPNLCLGA